MSAEAYRVDLHMHTNYSDGLDTPAQLVAKAAERGLQTIAITDHDTVDGLAEGRQAGARLGIEVLSGIELTVQYQAYDDIHILGYLFDPAHTDVRRQLERIQQGRVQRGLAILERVNDRLKRNGLAPLDPTQVLQRTRGTLTRPHLARALLAQGYVTSFEDAFQTFLIPCDVPKTRLHPEEAFALLRQAGGLSSLAHPGTISADPVVLKELLATFKEMGLDGVETYHHAHFPDAVDFFVTEARRHDLMVTGGSDYHGLSYGAILGEFGPVCPVPEHVIIALRQAQAAAWC